MKGTINYCFHDDERSTDYELLVSYHVYPPERETRDCPGSPATCEFEFSVVDVLDWSYDAERAVTLSFHAENWSADGIVHKWLEKQLELSGANRQIEEACFEDANDQWLAANEAADDSKFERARLEE